MIIPDDTTPEQAAVEQQTNEQIMCPNDDDPRGIASITADGQTAVLFSDGAMTIAGEGEVWCSAHGNLMHDEMNEKRCNHTYEGSPEPVFDATEIVEAIENDTAALEDAADRLLDLYPEMTDEL